MNRLNRLLGYAFNEPFHNTIRRLHLHQNVDNNRNLFAIASGFLRSHSSFPSISGLLALAGVSKTPLPYPQTLCIIPPASLTRGCATLTVRDSFQLVDRKDYDDLERIHRLPPRKRRPVKLTPIGRAPHLKGVVLKTLIRKPKKPNSANRKCVLVRLSNGKETVVYVPGEGHNLQEHSTVLVQKHRTPDLFGVKLRVMRGKYDCAPVKRKTK